MDLKTLQAFCMVARGVTLARAASDTRLSPGAISLQIKRLEAELGFKLFEHRPNKLRLTDEGERFLKVASRIVQELEKAKQIGLGGAQHDGEKITISMGNDSARFFSPAIASFMKERPEVATTILSRPRLVTLSLVAGGDVDIGLGRFGSVPDEIHKQELMESSLVLIFPSKHPFSRKAKLDLADLAAHRLIMPPPGMAGRKIIDRVFLNSSTEPGDIMEVSNCYLVGDYVALGLGAGFVHDKCLSPETAKTVRRTDLDGLFGKEKISLIYRREASLGPAHQDLIRTLTRYARKKK